MLILEVRYHKALQLLFDVSVFNFVLVMFFIFFSFHLVVDDSEDPKKSGYMDIEGKKVYTLSGVTFYGLI